MIRIVHSRACAAVFAATLLVSGGLASLPTAAQTVSPAVARATTAKTQKPPLHGRNWMAITGKPLGATAGAMMFERAATPSMPPAP